MTLSPSAPATVAPAIAALLVNAFVWGVSWWPFRWLAERGLHPLWATATIYLAALALIVLRRPAAALLMGDYPVLAAYVARGEARPAFQAAFAEQLARWQALDG